MKSVMANGSDEGVQIMSSYSVGVVACHFRCFLWGFFDHMLAHLMSVLFLDLGEGDIQRKRHVEDNRQLFESFCFA